MYFRCSSFILAGENVLLLQGAFGVNCMILKECCKYVNYFMFMQLAMRAALASIKKHWLTYIISLKMLAYTWSFLFFFLTSFYNID